MESGNSNENQFIYANMDNLKALIDERLDKMGLFEKIQDLTKDSESETEKLEKIKKSGLIDEVLNNLNNNDLKSQNNKPIIIQNELSYSKSNENPSNNLKLFVKLNSGHNFIDYDIKNVINESPSFFIFDLLFFGKRYKSKKIPTGSDFPIDESFILDFNPLESSINLNYSILKKISSPIHICLLLYKDNNLKLVASKSIEWRWVLCYGTYKIEAEFKSPSSLNNLNVGTVTMTISLLPLVDKQNLLNQTSITDQLNEERKNEIDISQDFINYTSVWWEDYKNIRPENSSRIIKLFLPTEDREFYSYKPSMSLIESYNLGRNINTPYEAARFVSLLPYERRENPGGEKIEIWHTIHSFLALMKGDVEDHCSLLCSLLLGFGLEAYIAAGVAINGPHLWVLTRNKGKKNDITFWESLTGQRVNVADPKVFRFYKQIHSIFNNNNFYANLQKDCTVFNTIYDFEDSTLWKSLPNDKIKNLPKYSLFPILELIPIDINKNELNIEKILKQKVTNFRLNQNQKTIFDNKLSFLIQPCLINYEMERVSKLTYGNDEFIQSIKNYVEEGFTFKAYPFCINELDVEKMFNMILSNDVGKDILNCRGDKIEYGVRVKIYEYPQGIYAVWGMLAVKYRVIK